MLVQIINLLGSIAVLGGYFLNQSGRISYNTWTYMLLNFTGSVLLGGISLYLVLYGYIMLNGVWGAITLHAMYKKWRSIDTG